MVIVKENSRTAPSGVAVVTGSAGDIGRDVIRFMLESNGETRCAAVDITPGHADEFVSEFGTERVLEVVSDATNPLSVASAFEEIVEWATPVTKLVNSVGTTHGAPSMEFPADRWEGVLSVHISGTFYWCQVVGRHMRDNSGGAIVNLSSVASYFGWPGRIPYGVAKAAVNSITQTLGVEWAQHGIRVNAVAPGYLDTKLARHAIEQGWLDEDQAKNLHAMKRFGDVREVTAVIAFLLSDEASYMTGEIVKVDGGYSAFKAE